MKPKFIIILLSTLFSIILWVFVSFSQEYSTTFTVPVSFTQIKDGYSLLSQSSSSVTLTVKGQGWALSKFSFSPRTKFSISTKENIGTQRSNVRDAISQNSWISSSVQVVMISPPEIKYTIEETAYKTVPINHDISISVKEGYGLVSHINLYPDSVEIWGPKSLVRNINTVYTEKFLFNDCDNNISQKLNLVADNHISFKNNVTTVEFEVQKIVDKTFENVVLKIINVPNLRKLELFPPTINVTLRGGLENLGRSSANDIKAVVDFNDAFKDTLGYIKPSITLPDFTSLIDVKPKKLDYIIKQY